MAESMLRQVPLKTRHVQEGARLTPFAGYEMPVQFTGILEEHRAVRESAGLFDVSHMGQVFIRGPEAIEATDRLITNRMERLRDGQALYGMLCNDEGGIIDDIVVYRLTEDEVLLCVNAANRERDVAHLKERIRGDAQVEDRSESMAQLALQGPKAQELLAKICDLDLDGLRFFRCAYGNVAGQNTLIARTGYTGEDGFELYLEAEQVGEVYDSLLELQTDGLTLCGLGCRDTLRLEAGLLLYGQDIDETTNPLEAGLGWTVPFERKGDFIGRAALEKIRDEGITRQLTGFVLQGRGVLRPGYAVKINGEEAAVLTSGSYGPTLERSVGLGYIKRRFFDEQVGSIQIRRRSVEVSVVKPPFYKRSGT